MAHDPWSMIECHVFWPLDLKQEPKQNHVKVTIKSQLVLWRIKFRINSNFKVTINQMSRSQSNQATQNQIQIFNPNALSHRHWDESEVVPSPQASTHDSATLSLKNTGILNIDSAILILHLSIRKGNIANIKNKSFQKRLRQKPFWFQVQTRSEKVWEMLIGCDFECDFESSFLLDFDFDFWFWMLWNDSQFSTNSVIWARHRDRSFYMSWRAWRKRPWSQNDWTEESCRWVRAFFHRSKSKSPSKSSQQPSIKINMSSDSISIQTEAKPTKEWSKTNKVFRQESVAITFEHRTLSWWHCSCTILRTHPCLVGCLEIGILSALVLLHPVTNETCLKTQASCNLKHIATKVHDTTYCN